MDWLYEFVAALSNPALLDDALTEGEVWLFRHVLVFSTFVQFAIVGVAFVVARLATPHARAWLTQTSQLRRVERGAQRVVRVLNPLTLPLIWLILQWLSVLAAVQADYPHHLIQTTVSLLTAWVIIRLASQLVRDPTWSSAIAVSAWTIAELNIVGLLDEAVTLLDGIAVQMGGLRISALLVLKGVMSLALLLWLATSSARILEKRISRLPNLTPSIRVLFSKLLKIVLIAIAVIVALRSVGIDLTAFAVLSGAIGVGIGFGLQKAVSNLISGVMLLLDKSIKPGDVIAVGGTYGWVESLGARYVSVVTRDGIEHLIPNEDFITQGVENWSFSNNAVRLRIPIGVSYKTDVRLAMRLCLEAAAEVPRVIGNPRPVCLLRGFGESCVDLELRLWIDDPQNGVSNVKSEILLKVWDKFREHQVEIPFPQRDLHLKPPAEVTVAMTGAARGGRTENSAAASG